MSNGRLIRKINIGVYAPRNANTLMINKTLKSINYGRQYPVNQIYLWADKTIKNNSLNIQYVKRFSEEGSLTKAAFFNKLICTGGANAFLFIEAGVEVVISQLLQMIIHLNHSPKHAIVIPRINNSLDQSSIIGKKSNPHIIQRDVEWEEIPLYDNSNYCYLVRKELIEEIGTSDITYQSQDYWTQDFNIRARLKEKEVVFLTNVFVTRMLENECFDLTNDKCSLEKKVLKMIANKLSNIKTINANDIKINTNNSLHSNMVNLGLNPLVSCIMPTANRPEYIKQSINYFFEQDYANKELVVVFNEDSDLPEDLPKVANIRFIKTTEKSIGGKRNIACMNSKGLIIAQWDDDDLYGPERLKYQVDPIIVRECEITGLCNIPFFGLDDWSFWKCNDELHQKLFVENVAGGTLVFLKKVWEIAATYPNTSLREDADFLIQAIKNNARLKKLDSEGYYVYLRHHSNSWQFKLGNELITDGWIKCNEFELVNNNKSFYLKKRRLLETVSCIMPTHNRSKFIKKSIQQFLNQNYSYKELIIADDGDNSIEHMVPKHPQIKYFRLKKRMTIGAKRNFCCEKAIGEIIMHWDDDDWYATDWLKYQKLFLQSSKADVCGLSELYFCNSNAKEAWKYKYSKENKAWVAGATLAYKKSVWKEHPFQDVDIGEDNAFVWQWGVNVQAHNYMQGFVATVHSENTSVKNTQDIRWKLIDFKLIDLIKKEGLIKQKITP